MKPPRRLFAFRVLSAVAVMLAPALAGAQTFTVAPTSLAFGNQATGITSAPKTFTITNGAASDLTFTLSTTGDYAAVDQCSGTVPASGTCIVSATLTPTTLGARNGSITVTDTTNSGNTRTVTATGNGVVPTTLSTDKLAFGDVVQNTASATKNLKITNNQSVPLTGLTLTPSKAVYSVSGCPATLNPGATCTAQVLASKPMSDDV